MALDRADAIGFDAGALRARRRPSCSRLDDDGVSDLVLPQPITAFSVGVEARSGKTGKQLWSARWDDAGATTGVSLAVLDDHDGDGARDILVGSSDWYWHGTVNRMGEIRLLSGKTGELIWKIGVDDFEALALSEEKRK